MRMAIVGQGGVRTALCADVRTATVSAHAVPGQMSGHCPERTQCECGGHRLFGAHFTR